jgi:hypothetical protein
MTERELSHGYVASLPPVDQNQIDEFGHVSDVEFNKIGRKSALEWFSRVFGLYAKWCVPITKAKVCSYFRPLTTGASSVKVRTGLLSWDPDAVSMVKTVVYDGQTTYYSETRRVKVVVRSPALSLRGIGRDIGLEPLSKL